MDRKVGAIQLARVLQCRGVDSLIEENCSRCRKHFAWCVVLTVRGKSDYFVNLYLTTRIC